jgi:uncharacterized protein YjiS (DUF1127 family)
LSAWLDNPIFRVPWSRIRRLGPRVKAMSSRQIVRSAPLGSIAIFRLVAGLERLFAATAAWRNARLTERELHKLSDQQLEDVGLFRGQIADIADDLAKR